MKLCPPPVSYSVWLYSFPTIIGKLSHDESKHEPPIMRTHRIKTNNLVATETVGTGAHLTIDRVPLGTRRFGLGVLGRQLLGEITENVMS